jgi:pyruvate ferredoxin oxidoreductase delta subunit
MAKPIDQIKWQELAIGAVVVEGNSSREYETGAWRTERPSIDNDKCIKCGVCWIFCPDVSIDRDSEGRFEVNLTYCKGCGICANECPISCITMISEEK